jgi:hypothetical protein
VTEEFFLAPAPAPSCAGGAGAEAAFVGKSNYQLPISHQS